MTLNNSAEFIYCQTCANAWPLTDVNTAYYFQSPSLPIGSYTSPALIAGAAEQMTFCPRCDVGDLAPEPIPNAPAGVKGIDQFYDGPDTVMTGADTDAGGKDPGDANVVHETQEP